jgi:hypothetical protein
MLTPARRTAVRSSGDSARAVLSIHIHLCHRKARAAAQPAQVVDPVVVTLAGQACATAAKAGVAMQTRQRQRARVRRTSPAPRPG